MKLASLAANALMLLLPTLAIAAIVADLPGHAPAPITRTRCRLAL